MAGYITYVFVADDCKDANVFFSENVPLNVDRPAKPVGDESSQISAVDDTWDSPSEEEEVMYGATPPYSSRQMKRMSGKHQRNIQSRTAGRSPNKGKLISLFD